MRIIEITALSNGAHRNQTLNGVIPDGWAILPDEVETENFPFGEPTVEVINGVPTVMTWTPGVLPEPEEVAEVESKPTALEQLRADVDYIAIMTGVEL